MRGISPFRIGWGTRLLLLVVLLCFSASVAMAAPPPVHVSPSGVDSAGRDGSSLANAWRTITYAMSRVSSGGTIYVVDDGVDNLDDYVENVVVNKSVTIAPYSGNTNSPGVLAASNSTPVFQITAADVTLEGLRVTGASASIGVELVATNGCRIDDNTVGIHSSPNQIGVSVNGGSRNILTDNLCYSNSDTAIELLLTSGNVLYNNLCEGSPIGLNLASGSGNVLVLNVMQYNDSPAAHGLEIGANAENNIICHNVMTHNYYGLYMNGLGGNIAMDNIIYDNLIGMFITNTAGQEILFQNSIYGNTSTNAGCAAGSYTIGSMKTLLYKYDGSHHKGVVGNYFGDYAGSDANGDGIGDNAYLFNAVDAKDPCPVQVNGALSLKTWMLLASSGGNRLYEDNTINWSIPQTFAGYESKIFATTFGSLATWTFAGGDLSGNGTWTGWLTFAAPPASGHEIGLTIGVSDADGANFQARVPTATLTGDGAANILHFAAPSGSMVLPKGKRLAVKIENMDADGFHLMASGAGCVLSAPLASRPGGPLIPRTLLLDP